MENRPGRSRGENDFHNFGNVEVKKISIIVFFFGVGKLRLSGKDQLWAELT